MDHLFTLNQLFYSSTSLARPTQVGLTLVGLVNKFETSQNKNIAELTKPTFAYHLALLFPITLPCRGHFQRMAKKSMSKVPHTNKYNIKTLPSLLKQLTRLSSNTWTSPTFLRSRMGHTMYLQTKQAKITFHRSHLSNYST